MVECLVSLKELNLVDSMVDLLDSLKVVVTVESLDLYLVAHLVDYLDLLLVVLMEYSLVVYLDSLTVE
jgi:hypothetical protein